MTLECTSTMGVNAEKGDGPMSARPAATCPTMRIRPVVSGTFTSSFFTNFLFRLLAR